jgi:hypothetical protein
MGFLSLSSSNGMIGVLPFNIGRGGEVEEVKMCTSLHLLPHSPLTSSTPLLLTIISYIYGLITILSIGSGYEVLAVCPSTTLRVIVPRVTISIVPSYTVTWLSEHLRTTPPYDYGSCLLNITQYTIELSPWSNSNSDTYDDGGIIVYDNNNNIVSVANGSIPSYDVAIVPSLTAYALRQSSLAGGYDIYHLLSMVQSWNMGMSPYTGASYVCHPYLMDRWMFVHMNVYRWCDNSFIIIRIDTFIS